MQCISKKSCAFLLFGTSSGCIEFFKKSIIKCYKTHNNNLELYYFEYTDIKESSDNIKSVIYSNTMFETEENIKAIIITGVHENLTDTIEQIIFNIIDKTTNILLILCANELKKNSKTRSIFEDNKRYGNSIYSINCYKPEGLEKTQTFEYFMNKANITITNGSNIEEIFLPDNRLEIAQIVQNISLYCNLPFDVFLVFLKQNIKHIKIQNALVLKFMSEFNIDIDLDNICASIAVNDIVEISKIFQNLTKKSMSFILFIRILQKYLLKIINAKTDPEKENEILKSVFGNKKKLLSNTLENSNIYSINKLLEKTIKMEIYFKTYYFTNENRYFKHFYVMILN